MPKHKKCSGTFSFLLRKILISLAPSHGAKAIAQAVGKPYSTLLREVNPYDTGAKLGAETLMHIMKTTGNVTPLEKMALEMGYRLEPAEGMGSTVRA